MILRNSMLSLAATAAIFGVASVPAFAFTFGTLGFNQVGTATWNGTSITLPSTTGTVNAAGGGLSGLMGSTVTFSPNPVTPGSFFDFTIGTYTFTDTTPVSFTNLFPSSVIVFPLLSGSFTGPGVPAGTTGTFNVSFPYVPGSSTSVNESYTFSANTIVPEPGNVAMLVGMGMSGVGFLVRRRRAK